MMCLHEQMHSVQALHYRDSSAPGAAANTSTLTQCWTCHAVHVMSVSYSPTAFFLPQVIVTVAIHSGPASLLLQPKVGIHATPLAGRKVFSYRKALNHRLKHSHHSLCTCFPLPYQSICAAIHTSAGTQDQTPCRCSRLYEDTILP